MNRRALIIMLIVGINSSNAEASPETILTFDSFIAGSESGSRFGAQVACSNHAVGSPVNATIVVGAPHASAGEGRVQAHDPLNPITPIQILKAPPGAVTRRFGAALEFIDDIGGDGLDDLLVGAPGDGQDSVGHVFAFTSLYFNGVTHYIECGSVSGPLGFGSTLRALRGAAGGAVSNVVVGNPTSGRIDGVSVTVEGTGVCRFSLTGEFSVSRGASSQFGGSLAQVGALHPDGSLGLALLVAAASEGRAGVIHQLTARTPIAPGDAQSRPDSYQMGTIVSAYHESNFYVVGSPHDNDYLGSVGVYRSTEQPEPPYCTVRNPGYDSSGRFGSNVYFIGGAFRGGDLSAADVVALVYGEYETGGAVALVGVGSSGCTIVGAINNCQHDSGQEQASSIAGGANCAVWLNGREQRLLVLGSPGWSESRGRVDIAFEDKMRSTPMQCSSGSSSSAFSSLQSSESAPMFRTATPEPNFSSSSSSLQSSESAPIFRTATPEPNFSSSSSNLQSSESAPMVETATPTPTAAIESIERDTGSTNGVVGADREGSFSAVGQDQPLIVGPGTTGLPAPSIVVANGVAEVNMPLVTPELATAQRAKVIRNLQKKRGLSKNRAAELLDDPDNLVVTYIVYYLEVATGRRFALIQKAYADGPGRRASKVRQIRDRRNSVALRNIRPGALYRVYYTVEISLKRPRSVIGVSKPSATSTFTAS